MKSIVTRDSWHVEARETRKKEGITQHEMAHLTGIYQSRISQIENGEVDPKLSEIVSIAETLQMVVVMFPDKFQESVEHTIDVCVRMEERKTRPPTIPEMILGDRAYS